MIDKEDYIELTDKAKEHLKALEDMTDDMGIRLHVFKTYVKDSDIIDYIAIDYLEFQSHRHSLAQNEISLTIWLLKKHNYLEDEKDVERRLEEFLTIMKKVRDKELDVTNVGAVHELAEDMYLGLTAQQLEEYDYTVHV